MSGSLAAGRGGPGVPRGFADASAAPFVGKTSAWFAGTRPSSTDDFCRSLGRCKTALGKRHTAFAASTQALELPGWLLPDGACICDGPYTVLLTADPPWCSFALRRDPLTCWGFGCARPEAPFLFPWPRTWDPAYPRAWRFKQTLRAEGLLERPQLLPPPVAPSPRSLGVNPNPSVTSKATTALPQPSVALAFLLPIHYPGLPDLTSWPRLAGQIKTGMAGHRHFADGSICRWPVWPHGT